jgi:hypothetical protein
MPAHFSAGMADPPKAAPSSLSTIAAPVPVDPRLAPLCQFFAKTRCPAGKYAAEFLSVADEFDLDWRLLPSISFVETGGGRASKHNNIFGWDCGRARFDSPSAAIRSVGSHLTRPPYRSRNTDKILAVFNRHREYAQRIKSVMRQIASVP